MLRNTAPDERVQYDHNGYRRETCDHGTAQEIFEFPNDCHKAFSRKPVRVVAQSRQHSNHHSHDPAGSYDEFSREGSG